MAEFLISKHLRIQSSADAADRNHTYFSYGASTHRGWINCGRENSRDSELVRKPNTCRMNRVDVVCPLNRAGAASA